MRTNITRAERRSPVPSDITRVVRIGDLAVSPHGDRLLFTHSSLKESGDARERSLWLLDVGAETPTKTFAGADSPAWAPGEGSTFAFLRPDDDGLSQVSIATRDGSCVGVLSNVPGGVDEFRWSPDGKFIAAISTSSCEPLPDGVRIHTHALFRSGNSYMDTPSPSQIWILDASAGASCSASEGRQLTYSSTSKTLCFWSNDSQFIYFTTDDAKEAYYGDATSSLRKVNVADAAESLVYELKEPGTGGNMSSAPELLLSPDGSHFAFSIGDPRAPDEFALDKIYVVDLATGHTRGITDNYDREVGGDGFLWRDSHRIIAINSDHGNANVVEIDIHSEVVTPIWTGEHVVHSISYASLSYKVFGVSSTFITPAEIYEVSPEGAATPLTAVNNFLVDELALSAPEKISYPGPGGQTIYGYIYRHPNFSEDNSYGMVTTAHGGPYSWWNSQFAMDVQCMAAAGYLVFQPNPRGSVSYGQAFASALAEGWPGPEYDDIMAGIDYLAQRPFVDQTRIAIIGASAGGTLVDWAITHTDRFAAAVSISDIADFNAYWFLGDQPELENPGGQPWLSQTDKALSPITYGTNVKTPTLFVSGTSDFRTPAASGSEIMFRLLKYLRVPTALIEFEGAGHAISSSDNIHHPALSVRYQLRWLDRHLKGVAAPEFDI